MKNLCYWLPPSVVEIVSEKNCTQCNTKINKDSIIGVGIREHQDAYTIFVEHVCQNCDCREMTFFGRQFVGSLEDMCYALLESIQDKKLLEKSKSVENTPKPQETSISDSEVKNLLDLMNNSSFDDFLKHIGAEQYKEKNDDKNKN